MPLRTRFTATSVVAGLAMVFLCATANFGHAQVVLTNIWSISTTSGPPYTYINTDGSQRGIAYNPTTNHAYVVSRPGGNTDGKVFILDGSTGAHIGELDVTNVSGSGLANINLVDCTDDGEIYICNLAPTVGTFQLYRYTNELSPPVLVFFGDPTAGDTNSPVVNSKRFGDTMATRGNGTNVQVLVHSRGGRASGLLFPTDDSKNTFAAQTILTDTVNGDLGLGAAFGKGNSFWSKAPARNLRLSYIVNPAQMYNVSVPLVSTTAVNVALSPPTTSGLGSFPEINVLAVIDYAGHNLKLYDTSGGDPVLQDTVHFPLPASGNGNLVGEAAFGTKDGVNFVYAVEANNGVQALQLIPAFYTLKIHPGYTLIANQLDRGGNTVSQIMPGVPSGCFLQKYNNITATWTTAYYSGDLGAWMPGNITLSPGEGAFFYSPINFDLTLSGAPHVPVLPLPDFFGCHLLSRQTNNTGTFDNIIGTPPLNGAEIHRWVIEGYNPFIYDDILPGWIPAEPFIPVGESAWICPHGGGPPPPPPPVPIVITTQPKSQMVNAGSDVTFTVVAAGSPPLTYQWRLNGVNIPGATSDTLLLPGAQPLNNGDYSVVVANSFGAVNSRIAKLIVSSANLGFADNFADALITITNSPTGVGSGVNTNATKEAGETNHVGNPGGKSVWYAWHAPDTGIATFSTLGSSFDTLLAVYTGTSVSNLLLVASDDDSAGFLTSRVMFNAVGGQIYYIAMDGSYGSSGSLVLSWNLEVTNSLLPEIVLQPRNQIAPQGTNVNLSVLASPGAPVEYQWFLNDVPITNANNSMLTIPNLQVTNLGIYKVRVTSIAPDPRAIFSSQAIVQMGAAGDVAALDKFLDVSPVGGGGPGFAVRKGKGGGGPASFAPAGGFTGTQIFNTYGAGKEPGEPNHCSVAGGASYWYAYQAPANGNLTVDTIGSAFDTVLAVYTGPGTSFTNLVSVACANVSGPGGDAVTFPGGNGTIYYIAVDGVGGVTGAAQLNYNLVVPPVITLQPQSRTVPTGGNVTLTVAATGVPPPGYQWRFNSGDIASANQSALALVNFQLVNEGNYTVAVTNAGGSVISATATLYRNLPLREVNPSRDVNGNFQTQLLGPAGSNVILQASTDLINWTSVLTNSSTSGIINFTDTNTSSFSKRFFRTLVIFP